MRRGDPLIGAPSVGLASRNRPVGANGRREFAFLLRDAVQHKDFDWKVNVRRVSRSGRSMTWRW